MQQSDKRVLVIIPAFNEETAIVRTVTSIIDAPMSSDLEVLVVNDGSVDDTQQKCEAMVAENPRVHLVNLPFNSGIGAAVQTGFLYAQRHDFDFAVQYDGDGQHCVESLETLIHHAITNDLDLCIGSRYLKLDEDNFKSTYLRRVGIRFFATLIQALTGAKITDTTSGFRVYGKRAIAMFSKNYPDDYPEPEAVFRCVHSKMRVEEIPAKMRERDGGESSINNLKSAYYMLKVTMAILIERLRKREVLHQ
ncbi:MAG: glycosyltransferase family 2 protein [Lentisphaeria bacterium]|nr:glycosyltransferase family 2 protein [Lentisphaeria bacterium]